MCKTPLAYGAVAEGSWAALSPQDASIWPAASALRNHIRVAAAAKEKLGGDFGGSDTAGLGKLLPPSFVP